ncbi:MAG: 4-hydroxy-tetrahydrodipicolinate synthase [Alphaproteobacteria bacterium]|jgi:4-hydroxy-tetrahydrodipicolinate synthase|nr:4-hydroxy-tetrahydrodipicolinate synthase [Alphaproteobacteria bacterium]
MARDITDTTTPVQGIWLPLITPFLDGVLDEASLRRLVRHYAQVPLDGIILAGTTGESMTLDDAETERLTRSSAEALDGAMPLWLGLSGSDTAKLIKQIERTADWPIDGYLITVPYYTRPSQEGLFEHFSAAAQTTDRPIIVYNIPYRTGVNLANDTLLRLAERDNIVGVKDCCADPAQSFALTAAKPDGFGVLTGEDAFFHAALCQGADGGILAAAHVETAAFARVRALHLANDRQGALQQWRELVGIARLLFREPNPAAVKYWLYRAGLITSPELRLPMMPASPALRALIDEATRSHQPGIAA